ncbi:hypothetical protein [Variovorax sp. YR750]|uniref:hypothetical protein n=1 Tax=Variovorax sp. YR750 TaxID=1884384 RepID=UPI001160600D|nr:hypothetical protein [Variovorax sp. YR750]
MDVTYAIHPASTILTPLSLVSSEELSGSKLWQFFSNPSVKSGIWVNAEGRIRSAALGVSLEEGFKELPRLTTEDYRSLAHQFLSEIPNQAVRPQLEAILGLEDFYSAWVNELRILPSGDEEIHRKWDSVRFEHIAKRLGDALIEAGVGEAKAAEIVARARMRKSTRPVAPGPAGQAEHASAPTPMDDAAKLRQLVHAAVDLMSIAELRELKIPAGALLDAKLN